MRWTGGGGYGDPMDRAVEALQHDLDGFAITPAAAERIYGCVLDGEGRVDPEKTAERRAALRAAVAAEHKGPKPQKLTGKVLVEATDTLAVRANGAGAHWACGRCDGDLGPVEANYKDGCLRRDRPVSDSNPLVGDPKRFIDDEVAFRQFHCPSCGGLIENEIAVASDAVLADIAVKV